MDWWKKLFGNDDANQRGADYYREGLELLKVGRYHDAITSFRLALREDSGDVASLQQIAVAQTRIGTTHEAIKTYRDVLDKDPETAGAHYGLAFLLLREGRVEEPADHLRKFLDSPPRGPDAGRHISHARRTLEELTDAPAGESDAGAGGESGTVDPAPDGP